MCTCVQSTNMHVSELVSASWLPVPIRTDVCSDADYDSDTLIIDTMFVGMLNLLATASRNNMRSFKLNDNMDNCIATCKSTLRVVKYVVFKAGKIDVYSFLKQSYRTLQE